MGEEEKLGGEAAGRGGEARAGGSLGGKGVEGRGRERWRQGRGETAGKDEKERGKEIEPVGQR